MKMWSPSVCVCLLFTGSLAAPGSQMEKDPTIHTFEMNIEESGTAFTQRVVIDEDKNIETIVVPSHNRVTGATYIHDFNLNLTLRREVDSGRCFLTDLSHEIQDGRAAAPREMLAAMRMAKVERGQDFQTVAYTWMYGQVVGGAERDGLGQEMKDLCDGQTIQRLDLLHDTVDIHEVGADDVILPSSPTRRRRQSGVIQCVTEYQKMRCIINLYNCRYVVTCNKEWLTSGRSMNDCRNHVYDRVICCADCCGDESRSDPTFFPYCGDLSVDQVSQISISTDRQC